MLIAQATRVTTAMPISVFAGIAASLPKKSFAISLLANGNTASAATNPVERAELACRKLLSPIAR